MEYIQGGRKKKKGNENTIIATVSAPVKTNPAGLANGARVLNFK